jgi:release factor glutamine methyltransferase
MSVNLLTIKDIRTYLKMELGDLYDDNEISTLTRSIIKTIFRGSGLHELYNTQKSLNNEESLQVKGFCEELRSGKPFQYILGETEFYNCSLELTPDVLIPRPETEELTDLVIKENKDFKGEILDFGTGSGCISIALKMNLPGSVVTGIDISDGALAVAERNAIRNNAAVNFRKNDILQFNYQGYNKAEIIVSNPPYVRECEKSLMKRNVLDFEPSGALFVDDSCPLLFYEAILEISQKLLNEGGKIYFEINEAFGEEMKKLMLSKGFSGVMIVKDLNNRDRFAKGIKK